jgi:hypothetical protein
MTTTVEQVQDWMEHPEKYDISSDDDYARFIAWNYVIAELNGISIAQDGQPAVPANFDLAKAVRPTNEQILQKVNQLRQSRSRPRN